MAFIFNLGTNKIFDEEDIAKLEKLGFVIQGTGPYLLTHPDATIVRMDLVDKDSDDDYHYYGRSSRTLYRLTYEDSKILLLSVSKDDNCTVEQNTLDDLPRDMLSEKQQEMIYFVSRLELLVQKWPKTSLVESGRLRAVHLLESIKNDTTVLLEKLNNLIAESPDDHKALLTSYPLINAYRTYRTFMSEFPTAKVSYEGIESIVERKASVRANTLGLPFFVGAPSYPITETLKQTHPELFCEEVAARRSCK